MRIMARLGSKAREIAGKAKVDQITTGLKLARMKTKPIKRSRRRAKAKKSRPSW